MRVPALRTGYESILPYRMNENYCYMAEEDGIVESINPNTNIKILYKSGKKKTVKLGTWNTKEESNVSYKHTIVSDLKKGSKFKQGNTIAYDEAFFEPDIFDRTRVIFKTGTYLRVAMMETTNTYEDSTTISSKAAKKLGTSIIKSKSFVLNIEDNIINAVKIGDKLEPNDLLFSIAGSNIVDADGKFDKESLSILQNIKNKSPKAKMRGKVQNIRIYYNCELEDMSKTLRDLAVESNKNLNGYTGKVNSSYSIKGKPLLPNTVEVKIYIEDNVKAAMGDKLVSSLQLKCTISDVYDHDIITEDSRPVDMTFSTKSVSARIVASTTLNATTTTVLNVLRDQVVDMYFK